MYRQRQPDGSDRVVDFGPGFLGWPPAISDFVSSITIGIALGSSAARPVAWACLRIDHWA
jgi:hypothetical protein